MTIVSNINLAINVRLFLEVDILKNELHRKVNNIFIIKCGEA